MFTCAEELKPTITPIESHTGLYFDETGHIFLSNPVGSFKLCEFKTESVIMETRHTTYKL